MAAKLLLLKGNMSVWSPVPPSHWYHSGNNWPLEMWQVKKRLQMHIHKLVCTHRLCVCSVTFYTKLFSVVSVIFKAWLWGEETQEEGEKGTVVKLGRWVFIFPFRHLCVFWNFATGMLCEFCHKKINKEKVVYKILDRLYWALLISKVMQENRNEMRLPCIK